MRVRSHEGASFHEDFLKTVKIFFLLDQQISTDCSIITDKDYKAFPRPHGFKKMVLMLPIYMDSG